MSNDEQHVTAATMEDDADSHRDSGTDGPGANQALSQFAELVQDREPPEEVEQETPALSFDQASVYYGDFQAVKEVSFDVPRGEVTSIIGPSGCGKSTLLNAINRMTDMIPGARVEGRLDFDGRNIYGNDMDVVWLRRRIGMVFQKPNPFPKSIYDNVAYGPRLHGKRPGREIDEIVERSLREAALWDEVKDRLKHNALGLSGGQQQRLCIARALAIDPQIVLLDEPTSALDPVATGQIEELLHEIRGAYSVIIVTHSMQQAARVSDYTLFLYEGYQVEFGRTADIFMNPKEERTRRYITGRFG